jgi:hypothetical protein
MLAEYIPLNALTYYGAYGARRDVIRRPPNAPTPNGVPANRGEP